MAEKHDPHKEHKDALEKSSAVLKEINDMLEKNPLLCSQDRRQEWSEKIKTAPNTTIGVLGNTGVGKSSLLNALLDEAAVLPTSGSCGCTATVVELRFNSDLQEEITVYRGEVEFITVAEWSHELKLLVGECSTHEEKTIYARPPEEQRQSDAAAAWTKINQVNGHGTMEKYHRKPMVSVYDRLV